MAVAWFTGILATILRSGIGGLIGETVRILGESDQAMAQLSERAGLSVDTDTMDNSPPPRQTSQE